MATSSDAIGNEDCFISLASLKTILECPVCLIQFKTTPIFRCENGHLVCKDCRVKIEKCPECRILLGYSRCLTSERIVLSATPSNLPCKFSGRGCKEKFTKDKLEDHELDCTHSLVKCSITSASTSIASVQCNENIPLLAMWEHLKTNHNVKTCYGGHLIGIVTYDELQRESMNKGSSFSLDPIHSSYAEYQFLTNICKKGNFWYFWVYIVGIDKEAENFECKILVRPTKSRKIDSEARRLGSLGTRGSMTISAASTQEIQFKGRCVSSLLNSPLSILEGQNKIPYLVVSQTTMDSFSQIGTDVDDAGVQYKFSILKLK